MTRFADELFDDLMREHGSALAHTRAPAAPKRHPAARPVLLTAGAGGLAVAATVGSLLATGGGTPAYAVTRNSDGTVTLAVYQQSGIAAVNAQLHQLGDDRVVVVPVGSDCPSINSLPSARRAGPADQRAGKQFGRRRRHRGRARHPGRGHPRAWLGGHRTRPVLHEPVDDVNERSRGRERQGKRGQPPARDRGGRRQRGQADLRSGAKLRQHPAAAAPRRPPRCPGDERFRRFRRLQEPGEGGQFWPEHQHRQLTSPAGASGGGGTLHGGWVPAAAGCPEVSG